MRAPVVSVVIPTRNRATLLPVAIQSALRQTFADLEVVVVDDASTDGTPEVVRSFADPRLRYLRQEVRGGGSAARNVGIKAAKGEYVAFLDDDDEWLPHKLQKQMEVFRAGGKRLGVVYASYDVVDRETGFVLGQKVAEKRGSLAQEILKGNFVGGTSAAVLRRECFEKAGFFDEALPSYQDYDLWIRMAKHFAFDFVSEPLLSYYVHKEKIWRDLDALNDGIRIMLEKHGAAPAMRRNLSYASLRLGTQYCEAGRCADGRRAFWRAIRLYPFEVRHYFNLGLSLLGGRGYKAVKAIKSRLLVSARTRSARPPAGDEHVPIWKGPRVVEQRTTDEGASTRRPTGEFEPGAESGPERGLHR